MLKKTWQNISMLLNKSNKNENEIKKLVVQGRSITDKSEIVKAFNSFFVNIGPSLSDRIDKQGKKPYSYYLKKNISSQFNFSHIDETGVLKIIKSLKNKTSSGPDGISLKFMKNIAPAIIRPLTFLINNSIVSGIFPDQLKVAKVIPLFKKDDTVVLLAKRDLLPVVENMFRISSV